MRTYHDVLGWCLATFWVTKIHHAICFSSCELLNHTSRFRRSFNWRAPLSFILRIALGCKPQTVFFTIHYLYTLNLFARKVLLAGVWIQRAFTVSHTLLLSKPYQVVMSISMLLHEDLSPGRLYLLEWTVHRRWYVSFPSFFELPRIILMTSSSHYSIN